MSQGNVQKQDSGGGHFLVTGSDGSDQAYSVNLGTAKQPPLMCVQ